MDPELALRVLDERRGSALREVIPSTMGEPLLWAGLDGLVDLCAERALSLNVTTNGTFPGRGAAAWAARLVPVASDVKISWNGATAATAAAVMPGLSLDAAAENVRALVAARDAHARTGGRRCGVSFQVTVQQANVHELADIVRLAASLGVDRVKLNHLQPRFPGLLPASLRRSPEAIACWNTAVRAARAAADDARLPSGATVLLQNAVELAPDPRAPAPLGPCPFVGREAWIHPDGRFAPCPHPAAARGRARRASARSPRRRSASSGRAAGSGRSSQGTRITRCAGAARSGAPAAPDACLTPSGRRPQRRTRLAAAPPVGSRAVPTEPLPTAFLLAAVGALLAVSVLASRASGRLGLPVALLFLLVGMLAGSEGLGQIPFEDYALTFRIGAVALVLILFDGGLNTDLASLRRVLAPGDGARDRGVAGTAAVLALGARALGLGWPESLLVGAIVSSTDAAAVFSTLRSAGVSIRQRLAHLLEVESGVNDPMAVILTLAVTGALVSGERPGPRLALEVVLQLAIGLAAGIAIGYAGRWLLARVRLSASGLYPVLTIALACFAFGAPTLLSGSGFVAVYAAAVVLGNGPLPHASGLRRVHDAMAWFSQVAMFLLLGLLAFPSRLASVAGPGLLPRPLPRPRRAPDRRDRAARCLSGCRCARSRSCHGSACAGPCRSCSGRSRCSPGSRTQARLRPRVLRGRGERRWCRGPRSAGSRAGSGSRSRPRPRRARCWRSTRPSGSPARSISFYVERASAVAGSRISDLTIPEGSAVMLVVRGRELLAARGRTVLEPGDHVYVFTSPGDKPFVQLLFGRQEED